MKKSIAFKLFAFALVALMVASCSKYEEGSKFTVLTKKSRVANTWELSALTANGTDIISLSTVSQIVATKDGAWTVTYTVGNLSSDDVGTWAFSDDKTQLIVVDAAGDSQTSDIVKLKANEMKTSYTANSVVYITTLVSK